MGNLISIFFRSDKVGSRTTSSSNLRRRSSSNIAAPQQPQLQPSPSAQTMSSSRESGRTSVTNGKPSAKNKYALIPDHFTTLEQVYMLCSTLISFIFVVNYGVRKALFIYFFFYQLKLALFSWEKLYRLHAV